MPTTRDYGYQLPTEDAALDALTQLIGREMAEGLWDLSSRVLGISRPVRSAADLRRMAEHLMTAGDLTRVGARSLKVRVVTYEALARTVEV
jgi:phosphate uptake regulator